MITVHKYCVSVSENCDEIKTMMYGRARSSIFHFILKIWCAVRFMGANVYFNGNAEMINFNFFKMDYGHSCFGRHSEIPCQSSLLLFYHKMNKKFYTFK